MKIIASLVLFGVVVGCYPRALFAQSVSCNFYASPTGAGNGLSYGSPTSIAGAQSLARAEPNAYSSRVVCLESGIYQVSSNWITADQFETWLPYAGLNTVTFNAASNNTIKIQSNNINFYGITWTGLNGINGTGSTPSAMIVGGSSVNFLWNDFSGCKYICIYGVDWTNSNLENNTFSGISPGNFPNGSPGNFSTAVNIGGGSSNVLMSHNLCINNQGGCLDISSYATTSNNNVMSCNETRDDQQSCEDCGDLYFQDSQEAGVSSGNLITDNIILGAGLNATKGIYLDNSASNVVVKRNVIAQDAAGPGCLASTSPAYGYCTPEFVLQYHGGDNNAVEDNVMQLIKWPSYTDVYGFVSVGTFLAYYQNCASPCGGMSSNTFENNIVFQSSGWPAQQLWAIDANGVSGPTVINNNYWTTVPTDWGFTDANPYNMDPDWPNGSTDDFTPIGNSTLINELTLPADIPDCQDGSGPAGTGPVPYSVIVAGFSPTPTITPISTPTASPAPIPIQTASPKPIVTPTPTPTASPTPGARPSINLVACVTASNGGTSGEVNLNVPTGTTNGNIMVAEIGCQAANLPTAPRGWNLLGTCTADGGGGAGCEYYRIASAEPLSYEWNSGAAGGWVSGVICAFSGENQSHPVDVISSPDSGNNSTPTVVSVATSASANDLLLDMFELEAGNFTKAADTTMGAVVQQSSGVSVGTAITYRTLTSIGATGNDAATMNKGVWASRGIALEPAVAAATTTPSAQVSH